MMKNTTHSCQWWLLIVSNFQIRYFRATTSRERERGGWGWLARSAKGTKVPRIEVQTRENVCTHTCTYICTYRSRICICINRYKNRYPDASQRQTIPYLSYLYTFCKPCKVIKSLGECSRHFLGSSCPVGSGLIQPPTESHADCWVGSVSLVALAGASTVRSFLYVYMYVNTCEL